MRRTTARGLCACLALGIVAAVAGCGGGSDNSASGTTDGSQGAGRKLRIVLVAHGPATSPDFGILANGFKHAGEDLNVSTEYRGTKASNTDPNEQRRLIEAAIATKPDGLIVTDPYPKSLNPVIKKATDAGIPVVLMNAGIGETAATGALTVFANDEHQSGVLGGQQMKTLGAKHALVVTTPPGAIGFVDERTKGFTEGFGGLVTQAQIPLSNLSDAGFIKNAIEAKLTKDSTIDAVFTIGSSVTPPALAAQGELGSRAKSMHWGAIDVPDALLTAMKNDSWDFALNQQQFSQPYLATEALLLNIKYGITPASDFIPTGPALITPANAARMAESEATHALK